MAFERNHDAVLETQLAEALGEVAAGRGDPLEVASLSGLLERTRPDSAALAAADAWNDSGGAQVLHEAFASIDFDGLVDSAVDPDADEDERYDALCTLDEGCAAVTYGGEPSRARAAIELAERAIHALPESWTPFSTMASRILEEASPLPDDPARSLWRAIEGARLFVEAPVPAAQEVRPKTRKLRAPRVRESVEAASSVLGSEPDKLSCGLGPRARLVLLRVGDQIWMIVEVGPEVQRVEALRDGEPVALEKKAHGYVCPYLKGAYVFWIDGAPHFVEVE